VNIFTPRGFLQVGGTVLVAVGILGMIGVIGPTADQSIFGSFWWFDNSENIAHLVLGIVGLAAAFIFPAMWQRYLVMALGVLGLVVGLYNIMGEVTVLGANLESPADLVLHLVVGVWALYAAFGGKAKSASV
jgi:hypothetical protein